MAQRFFYIICLLLIVLALPVSIMAAPAKLSGAAELRYAEQTVESAGVTTLDASHFIQQYSLLWAKEGQFARGRLGKYDLALGYEWSWVDSEINDQQVEIDNPLDKVLYRGDVTLAPGGLPFRMHAFSYDMHKTSFKSTNLGSLFSSYGEGSGETGIVTDIDNGSHVVSGITLEAGVQNGHFGGRYRDLLATLPRVLIDYRQQDTHDVKGPNPRDYIDRDLAFVSLNKKNNWFHYRRFDHKDRIDSTQDFSTDTFLLGTIDHNNRRQWVNLTNWIRVSTDISYEVEHSQRDVAGLGDAQRYDVNFFASAKRTRWQLDNFTAYSRVRKDNNFDNTLEIPFFARGELNRDTAWRFQMVSRQFQQTYNTAIADRSRDNIYLKGSVETYRQARYVVRPEIALESKSGTEGEGLSGRAAIELYSNRSYRNLSNVFAHYSIGLFTGTPQAGVDTSFIEHKLQGRLEREVNSMFRVGGEQELVYGSGSYEASISDNILPELGAVGGFAGVSGVLTDDILRSTSTVFVEISQVANLRNRFELSYELYDSSTVNGAQFSLAHRLDYSNRSLAMHWGTNYVVGNGLPGSGTSVADSTLTSDENFDYSLISTVRLAYQRGRSSSFKVTLDYDSSHYTNGVTYERIAADETYEYALWHVNGRVRKILVVGETAEYDKIVSYGDNEDSGLFAFSLFTNYFPTAHTLLSARLRYEHDDLKETETLMTFLSAGVSFSKFDLSLDYSYGRRPETDILPEVMEQKWEVKVKKTF